MAIDPIQFQGFTERQGFDPIKVPDPNPFLRENLNTIEASLRNLERGNLANMKAKADAYSRNLAQLSDFSQTLSGFLGTAAEIYDKKQEAAANALYYEDLASQENDITVLEEGEIALQAGDGVTSKAAVAANRNGAPYSVSKRIAELGGLKGYYYRVKATQDIASKYADYYDEARRTDVREISFGPNGQFKVNINEAEPTEIEESAIRAYLREEYLEQFSGISRGMLAKYAFPTMKQVDEARATANADRIALRDSERERYEAMEVFQQTVNTDPGALQKLLDTVSRTVVQDRNGKVTSLQYGGAWKQLQNQFLELATAGQYIDLEGLIGDQVNPDTGKKYMDDPMYSTKIKAIQVEIRKAETGAYRDSQVNGQVQFQKTLDEMIGSLPAIPTDSDYQAVYDAAGEVAREYNIEPDFSKLNHHRANYGQSALQVKHKMEIYRQQQQAGLLDPADLLLEPPEVQKEFLKIAEAQKELRENTNGFKSIDTQLKALITNNDRIKSVPGQTGATGGMSAPMLEHVTALHRQRTNELMGTEEYNNRPLAASLVAYQELEREVLAGRDNSGSIYYIDENGYSNFLKEKLGLNPAIAANQRLQRINKIAQTEGKAVLENQKSLSTLIDRETLVKAAEGWGRPGYRMDPAISYLAKKLGLSELNVIHRARDTFGMTELPALVEYAARAENASPDLKRALSRISEGAISKNQLRRVSSTIDLPLRQTFVAAQPAKGVVGPINSPNHPFFVSIGVNEGTRTANGGYTKNWEGHTDPGDGHYNRGTVSGGRGNKNTPQQVDSNWMRLLSQTQMKYDHKVSQYVSPGTDLYNHIMFNIIDLRVQAPAAVPDFVKRIPQIIAEGATPQVIGRLRAESFINPRTGRLEASGFNNNMKRLQADQTRRAGNFRIAGGS